MEYIKFTHNLVKRQCAEVDVGRCGMRRDGIKRNDSKAVTLP